MSRSFFSDPAHHGGSGEPGDFEIYEEKIKQEEIFDGEWVLCTGIGLGKKDVTLK